MRIGHSANHRFALAGAFLALLIVPDAVGQIVKGGPRRVFFKTVQSNVMEDTPAVRVSVWISQITNQDVTVPFTVGGNATQGVDYTITASPAVIQAGHLVAEIDIVLIDDDDSENTETIELTLGTPTGGALGAQTKHQVVVRDFLLGDPLDGLTVAEGEAFERGRAVFDRRFTPSEGLGPFYNATSCASCHSTPVSGGASKLYRNFYLAVYYEGTPSNQSSAIAPFLSQVVPAFGTGAFHATSTFSLEGGRPLIPATVFGLPVISAQRNSIPVFGTGLFEFVSDATITSLSDPLDSNLDGISGRINTQLNGNAIGRFGTKAQVNNIELFTRGPLQNQMGITTDPFEGSGSIVSLPMLQAGSDPNNPTTDDDGVPDPELSTEDLGDLLAFTRLLAFPTRTPFNDAATRGELLFEQIGCHLCHIPSLPSSKGPVQAYTDLLLHDMGPDLVDNIRLGDSFFALTEFRTQPLWGISQVGPYLHDGRAATLREATELHAGEALSSRNAFLGLTSAEQNDVITFLEHL